MHIQKIKIQNYRCFLNFSMEFHDGLNVIVGSNNSGKTGLLHAIQLINHPDEISIDDFNKNCLLKYSTDFKEFAPEIIIEYTISHEISEENTEDESIIKLLSFLGMDEIEKAKAEDNEKSEDETKESQSAIYSLIASVRMRYALDAKSISEYQKAVVSVTTFEEYCSILKLFQPQYKWNYTNGMTDTDVDKKEAVEIFKVDYIDAERNSEAIYRETRREIELFSKENNVSVQKLQQDLSQGMKDMMEPLLSRISQVIDTGRDEIGLSKGNISISQDMRPTASFSGAYVIDVKDTKSDYIVPLSHNGLGYNNLINIYMLIKLTEIQKGKDFRILCLEEPEAHLHPAMQYKLFKYLKQLDEENNLNQQIFVTTHSSHISSVAGIDNMFMLAYERTAASSDCKQQNLKRQFEDDDTEKAKKKTSAKAHMAKFLDVTRSDMLFADKVIFVEGIAEKLLLPAFMKKCGCSYEDEHISIVEIGGKHFGHFISIFDGNAITKKILCITDADFSLYDEDGTVKEIGNSNMFTPEHVAQLEADYPIDNLKIVFQNNRGKTFEPELFIDNLDNEDVAEQLLKLVMSSTMTTFIDECGMDFDLWDSNRAGIDGRSKCKIEKLIDAFKSRIECSSDENLKQLYKNLFFAELFLTYAKDNKGGVALSILVDEKLLSSLKVPTYIKEGLEWLSQ